MDVGLSPPLERFLGQVRRVRPSGRGYVACCPAHDDHKQSLSISKGRGGCVLVKCFAGCSAREIVGAAGLQMNDLFPDDTRGGRGGPRRNGGAPLTVADLAQSKRLPVTFLGGLGLEACGRSVKIPYFLEDGTAGARARRRSSTSAKHGSSWYGETSDGAILPYGLWRLDEARKAGLLVFVEGESDAWTLWYHGYPALGIPGADMTGTLRAEHLRDVHRLVIVKEPDKGGQTFVRRMRRRLRALGFEGETCVIEMQPEAKDPNALHGQFLDEGPDAFQERFQALLGQARPLDLTVDPEAPFAFQALERQMEGLAGRDLEERALALIEQAATLSPADLLRAKALLKEKAGGAFAREWASAVKKTPRVTEEQEGQQGQRLSAARLACLIMADEHFAKDQGRRLYRYASGVYRPDGAQQVRQRLQGLLDERGSIDDWGRGLQGDVLEFITVQAPALQDTWPNGKINLRNGILDVASRHLEPHTPDLLTTVQFGVAYDTEATCPGLRRFCQEVLPKDSTEVLAELTAWCMMEDNPADQAVMLRGAGSNGKSILLAVLTETLGLENVSAMELHEIAEDRFAAADLYLKVANIAADVTSAHLEKTGPFKAITSGDPVRAQRKFEHAFTFVNRAKLLFSANRTPVSEDTSDGFFRRWVVVPFTRTFKVGDGTGLNRRALLGRLLRASEGSGLLNWALERWDHVAAYGLTVTPTMAAAHRKFRLESNPLGAYLADATVLETSLSPSASIPCKEFLDGYRAFARANDCPVYSATHIGRGIKKLFPEVRRVRAYGWIDVHGSPADRPYVYQGLRWRRDD